MDLISSVGWQPQTESRRSFLVFDHGRVNRPNKFLEAMKISIISSTTLLGMVLSCGFAQGFLTSLFFRNLIVFRENDECTNPTNSSKYAIIVHGWKENCDFDWPLILEEKLTEYRGGCIICMNYKFFSNWNYLVLVKYTPELANTLIHKLRELESRGFSPDRGYIFGFSLGARIAIQAGIGYGVQKIAEIDSCDMAGPGFDKYEQPGSKAAAKNVQCIHTSVDKGSKQRDCHQDWLMGYCGRYQLAADRPPFGSHGLCPIFYNIAFEESFYAESNPKQCKVGKMKKYWPKKFRMGYMERRKAGVNGIFHSSTAHDYPYTKSTKYPNNLDLNSISFWLDGQKHFVS